MSTNLPPVIADALKTVEPPKPIAPSINAIQGARNPAIVKMREDISNTGTIKLTWARILLCGGSGAGKTTTAARFGTPEQTRIIFTRSMDQLIPLRSLGYTFFRARNWQDFSNACMYPEALFGEPWASMPDRVLVVDDITRPKEWVIADAAEDDKGRKRNAMQQYGEVNDEMAPVAASLYAKEMHIITTSHVDIKEDPIERVEKIWADMPKGVRKIFDRDTAFIFYLDTRRPWGSRLLTMEEKEVYEGVDDRFQKVVKTRYIYAKRKLDLKDETGTPLLQKWEPTDLRAVWNKITKGGASK